MSEDRETSGLSNVVRIDDERIRDHLGQIVRGTVEDTLNSLLEAEADRLCNAGRYERTEARRDTRAGSYPRKLHTRAGEVSLRMPKLRQQTFETAIIERYRRRESSVEEALIEMYLAGVSVRRVEDITEALWGTRVSPGTVSNLNKKIYAQIEAWRNRPIEGEHPYVYLDGLVLKRSWTGEVRNVSLLVAIGVSSDGFREILGICEGAKEDKAGWSAFLSHLKQRGLAGVRLVTSDACLGLVESIAESGRAVAEVRRALLPQRLQPRADHQGPRGRRDAEGDPCSGGPRGSPGESHRRDCQTPRAAARQGRRAGRGAQRDTLTYYGFPDQHWRRLRTNNPLERIIREIRRRTRVVGAFPDGQSALNLAAARLRHIAGTRWSTRRYLDMHPLNQETLQTA